MNQIQIPVEATDEGRWLEFRHTHVSTFEESSSVANISCQLSDVRARKSLI